jgi:small subunit ribosomal protein S2
MPFNKSMKDLKVNFKSFLPIWAVTTFIQLLNVGVHLGHSVQNTTPYAAWMILGQRQGSLLINLFKFIYMFRAGFFILQGVIRRRSPIWFINLDGASDAIIKTSALNCGEYWVTSHLINGLLSNYNRLKKAGRVNISAPSVFWKKKHNFFYKNFEKWGFTRATWPRTLFVSNVLKSYNVCHEALCLKVPTIGIVDTNSPQKYVTIAVPGNDESFSSLSYYNNLIAMFILYNKFSMIYSWYLNRMRKVSTNFKEWITDRILNKTANKKIRPNLGFYQVSNTSNLYGFNMPLYQNLWKVQELVKTRINNLGAVEVDLEFLKAKLQTHFSRNPLLLLKLKDLLAFSSTFIGSLRSGFRKPRAPARRFIIQFLHHKKFISSRKMRSPWIRILFNKFRINLTKQSIVPQKALFTFVKRWLLFSKTEWASTKLYYYYRIFLYNYLVASIKYRIFFSTNYFPQSKQKKNIGSALLLKPSISNNYGELRKVGSINRLFFWEDKQTLTNSIQTINRVSSNPLPVRHSTDKIEFFFLYKEVQHENDTTENKAQAFPQLGRVRTKKQGAVFGSFINKNILATQLLRFYNSSINLGLFKPQGPKQLSRRRLLNIRYE